MRNVSRFEANLIRILRCVLRRLPLERALPLIFREQPRPRCLSRACVELVQDSLAKGLPLLLARSGWRRERFLRQGDVSEGRLWDRTPGEQRRLAFSGATLEWLMWVTAVNPAETKTEPDVNPDELTVGDRLLLFFVYDRLHETLAGMPFLRQPAFAGHALVRLAFPDRCAEADLRGEPDFRLWFQPQHAWVLEAFQHRLARRWLEVETDKQQMTGWQALRRLGETQSRVLDRFLRAAEIAGRRDLARFVMETARQLLATVNPHEPWFRALHVADLRMADRSDVYHAGFAFLRELQRLQRWEQSARNVGFYDEDYTASQLWKSDWERFNGDAVCGQAQGVVERFTPFQIANPPTSGGEGGTKPAAESSN